jgi:hypothetical protein
MSPTTVIGSFTFNTLGSFSSLIREENLTYRIWKWHLWSLYTHVLAKLYPHGEDAPLGRWNSGWLTLKFKLESYQTKASLYQGLINEGNGLLSLMLFHIGKLRSPPLMSDSISRTTYCYQGRACTGWWACEAVVSVFSWPCHDAGRSRPPCWSVL